MSIFFCCNLSNVQSFGDLTRKPHKDFEKLFGQHRILVSDNFSKS
ncbi:MAG TPA: hypothetical protein PLQ81_01615 [bacterium]|nr:hypothetical protein [bacterium]